MSIIILNWSNGENDPFTYFSECLKRGFESMGRPTRIINTDGPFVRDLVEASAKGVEFAFAWQGLGATVGSSDTNTTTLWDQLRIPLLCYHGDHPCHMPGNHRAVSSWIRHVYAAPSFAHFANTHIPRSSAGTFFQPPVWFADGVKGRFEGDYFVLPKNIDDLDETLNSWQHVSQRRAAAFLLEAADSIIGEFRNGNRRNHHDIIAAMLTPETMAMLCEELDNRSELAVRMHVHALLDKIHRNAIAEHVVTELKDVPLKIYGRGWDRFKRMGNPRHEFLSFDSMSDNAFQFASSYGILDVAPVRDTLHDRTYRALGNKAGFLMGSDWQYELFLGGDYGDLFFDGAAGALRAKAEQVMQSPHAHREQCSDFARHYRQQFSLFSFVKYLESLGETVRAQAAT